MKICVSCGGTNFVERKRILLRGQPWWIWDDGYRFHIQPAPGNPLEDREPCVVFEYKHFDCPSGLPELIMDSLPHLGDGS